MHERLHVGANKKTLSQCETGLKEELIVYGLISYPMKRNPDKPPYRAPQYRVLQVLRIL